MYVYVYICVGICICMYVYIYALCFSSIKIFFFFHYYCFFCTFLFDYHPVCWDWRIKIIKYHSINVIFCILTLSLTVSEIFAVEIFYHEKFRSRSQSRTFILHFVYCLTISECLFVGSWRDQTWPDNWTSVTVDGKMSAQFEQTLLVTDSGCDVLTKRLNPDSQPYFMDKV